MLIRQVSSFGSFRRHLLHISAIVLTLAPLSAFAVSGSVTYGYDNQGRLKTLSFPNSAASSYTYDTEGNRSNVDSPDTSKRIKIAKGREGVACLDWESWDKDIQL